MARHIDNKQIVENSCKDGARPVLVFATGFIKYLNMLGGRAREALCVEITGTAELPQHNTNRAKDRKIWVTPGVAQKIHRDYLVSVSA